MDLILMLSQAQVDYEFARLNRFVLDHLLSGRPHRRSESIPSGSSCSEQAEAENLVAAASKLQELDE